jgi:hypothetical protein
VSSGRITSWNLMKAVNPASVSGDSILMVTFPGPNQIA